ncbi:unnamed protein product, partial [Rotaria sp. Silwood2]
RNHEGYLVKVCDFGLANTRSETEGQTKINNAVSSTLKWAAPEILRLQRHTDKSDVYSLGIVYWELAAYEIPYDRYEDGIIRAFVLAGDRLDIPKTTPFNFAAMIHKSWAHDPDKRPNSPHLIEMIKECMQNHCEFRNCAFS